MNEEFTIATLFERLLAEAHEVAPRTRIDDARFDALRFFAEDVRTWIDRLPEDEQAALLQRMDQYVHSGSAPGIVTPQNREVDECFIQLLSLILEPPPLLL